MRFLVLGCSGMAGHTISIYLEERGHYVVGFSRKGVPFLKQQVIGDACDEALVEEALSEGEFDIVVNCVGILNQYAERDPEGAAYLNGQLPHVLARLTDGTHTRVFHMSTDCVFSGNTGPYTEDSIPDGTTVYDRTKASGELRDNKNLTFRNSIVGPDMNPNGIGLFNWFMAQEGPVKGYSNAIWTGLTTLELAKAMEVAAEENVHGLVNMVPSNSISKFDLLCLFNEHLRGGRVDIEPFEGFKLDKTLIRTDFSCSFHPKGYPKQIVEMAKWIHSHRDLYPHYESGRNYG